MSLFAGSRRYTPKDRPPSIVRKNDLPGTKFYPLAEGCQIVTLGNYTPAAFVILGYCDRKGFEKKEAITLGMPYQTARTGTLYYCRLLTPQGIAEAMLHSLTHLNESRQTPELKSLLRSVRERVIQEGEDKIFRKLQLFRLPPQEAQRTIQQVLRDLNSNIINEALQ